MTKQVTKITVEYGDLQPDGSVINLKTHTHQVQKQKISAVIFDDDGAKEVLGPFYDAHEKHVADKNPMELPAGTRIKPSHIEAYWGKRKDTHGYMMKCANCQPCEPD